MGSSYSQKTSGFLSVKLNDTLEVDPHLIPNFSNPIPNKEINGVSTMHHVKNLNIADPTFNVPNKVDLLLDAAEIEDIFLDKING